MGVGRKLAFPAMRIALFSEVFLPKIDGITNRLANTLRCLEADGHECLVFAPDTAVPEIGASRVVRIPSLPFPSYPAVRVALPDARVLASLAWFRPDVVHAVGPAVLGVMGIAAARGSPRRARSRCRSSPPTTPTSRATCTATASASRSARSGR
jgi:hypothetical protein